MNERKSSITEGIRNSALIKNPVLFEAIGVAPVVAMAVSIKTAIMLSVISTVEFVLIESFTCLFLKQIKRWFRILVYAVLGVLINIPLFLFFNKFAPNETANVSIFLPLIAVNSMIALHCERIAVTNDFRDTVVDAISASVGYVFIIFTVGFLREVLGAGTFYGNSLNLPVQLSGLLLPFGGFLLLGFTAAIVKKLIKKKYPDENPELAFNLSEIADTGVDNIASFILDEHNPFEDMFASGELEKEGIETVVDIEAPSVEEEPLPKREKRSKKRREKVKEKKPELKAEIEAKEEPAEEIPEEKPRRRGEYTSEFDDILTELENIKKAPEEIIEDVDGLAEKYELDSEPTDENGGDEADAETAGEEGEQK